MMASNGGENMIDADEKTLESLLGYYFNEPELRDRVSTKRPNKRGRRPLKKEDLPGLAVLGEAVMGCVVVNHYFAQGMTSAEINEERLTRVSRENHARVARQIGLERYIEAYSGNTRRIEAGTADLGESLEEILGAVYLDDINAGGNGVGACWEVLKKINLI
jgi:dsRNA-specific ribonuclease